MGKVFTRGLMGELMRALGKIIICMAKALIHGVMVVNMKESI
jgi:hypothetical protein